MIALISPNICREIAELHKSNATQDSRAQQAALSAEMQVREELKMNIEQQRQQHQREREALIMQVLSLQYIKSLSKIMLNGNLGNFVQFEKYGNEMVRW